MRINFYDLRFASFLRLPQNPTNEIIINAKIDRCINKIINLQQGSWSRRPRRILWRCSCKTENWSRQIHWRSDLNWLWAKGHRHTPKDGSIRCRRVIWTKRFENVGCYFLTKLRGATPSISSYFFHVLFTARSLNKEISYFQ